MQHGAAEQDAGMTYSITDTWAKSTTKRMQKGGDLYKRPKTREEMLAPLAWHEEQLASVVRYGELADGSIGYLKVK
jgi:hypothetical protein